MQESIVTEILEERAKFGQRKDGKGEWSMSRVALANGESVFMFNPVELGQIVEAVKDGEYTNWKPKRHDPKHDEIMKALRAIYKAITGELPVKQDEIGTSPTASVAVQATTQTIPDVVIEDIGDEPIDLKDIPF